MSMSRIPSSVKMASTGIPRRTTGSGSRMIAKSTARMIAKRTTPAMDEDPPNSAAPRAPTMPWGPMTSESSDVAEPIVIVIVAAASGSAADVAVIVTVPVPVAS